VLHQALDNPKFLGHAAVCLFRLGALERLPERDYDGNGDLWECDAPVDRRADQLLSQHERRLIYQSLGVHARLQVLRRRANVGLKVERAERRWFGFARRQLR